MKKVLASILAAASVSAQLTGDHLMGGRASSMGSGMMGGTPFGGILMTLFWIGLVLFVWLWSFKLWKEIRRMK